MVLLDPGLGSLGETEAHLRHQMQIKCKAEFTAPAFQLVGTSLEGVVGSENGTERNGTQRNAWQAGHDCVCVCVCVSGYILWRIFDEI